MPKKEAQKFTVNWQGMVCQETLIISRHPILRERDVSGQ